MAIYRPTGPVRKKSGSGRIIKTAVKNGREMQLHATKGWRSYRAS